MKKNIDPKVSEYFSKIGKRGAEKRKERIIKGEL